MQKIKNNILKEPGSFETFDELFNYALSLARKDKCCAKEFFEKYIRFISEINNISIEESIKCAKSNFGYYAGYFNRETEQLVDDVFETVHPIFGCNSHDVSAKEAFEAGQKLFDEHNKNQ